MKPVTPPRTESTFVRANSALRKREFERAIALYEVAIGESDGPLKTCIRFNLGSALRRIGGQSAVDASSLTKPDGMDQFYFDLIEQGGFFDQNWYLTQYKNKHQITGNPLDHYLVHGVSLGTNPSQLFDTTYYLKIHKDVAESGIHPFLHYICQGHKEERPARPCTDQDDLEIYEPKAAKYVSRLGSDVEPIKKAVRVIAFYLPQFHPIPENDAWWGKDFTEWTNVRPASPQFRGHYQPHVPDDFLGYYDLRDTTVMRKQIELAKQYGVEGFCFYTYWFSGARLLETPVDNYLEDKNLNLPFCICWANENWSRRWDGLDNDLLMVQHYSDEDDIAFIAHMAKYLRDARYIRVQGKPLLIVYRPNLFPSMRDTARRWRGWCLENGIGDIYIAYVKSFEVSDPAVYGLDAAIEFPPNNSAPPDITEKINTKAPDFSGKVYDWRIFIQRSENNTTASYPVFLGACPSWDNTARKKDRGTILANSCPDLFERLLINIFSETIHCNSEMDRRLVFINAWNEWAEGAHLEPDERYGYGWLQAVRNANQYAPSLTRIKTAVIIHAHYPEILQEIMERMSWMDVETTTLYITTNHGKDAEIEEILTRYQFKFSITTLSNRGRDVLPFLRVLPQVLSDGAELVLKLHTKKSTHRIDGEKWRKELFDGLLAKSFVTTTKMALLSNDKFGLSAPAEHFVPMSYYWGSNITNMESLCRKIGWCDPKFDDAQFVAGTMFCAGRRLLTDLLAVGLLESDFEEEAGQLDGTMAHAVERMIGFICHKQDYKMVEYGKRKNDLYPYANRA
jgi:lipopolysaccharide biosynthesis protein